MADIALRSYIEEIDRMIDTNEVDEAIAHAKYILGIYPKNLEAYRALAKGLLEKNRHMDAADIFQRVLSAVPDDFVSHIGMSIAREDESNIEAAIWHMERAFETQPSSGPVQEELRRLHGKREGIEPPKIRLTRGALARLYEKGHHYQQAIAELQAALKEEPDRYDLKVLLAQSLWHANKHDQSAEVCKQIIESLPFCREANRLMAIILIESGNEADAKIYRKRLEALDPYEAFADPREDSKNIIHVPADNVHLPHHDYVPPVVGSAQETSRPAWMQSVGVQFDQPNAPSDDAPDWLSGLNASGIEPQSSVTAAAPSAANDEWINNFAQPATTEEDIATAAVSSDELPDWMTTMSSSSSSPSAAVSDTPAEQSNDDWLNSISNTPTATAPESGDGSWRKGIEERKKRDSAILSLPAEPTNRIQNDSSSAESPDDVPDWLTGSVTESASPESTDSQSDLPDWLQGASSSSESQTPAASSTNQVPDWLNASNLAAEPETSSATDAIPDWLKQEEQTPNDSIAAFLKNKPVTAPLPSLPKEEEKPDWLKQMEAESDEYEATSQPKAKAPEPEVSAMPPSSEDDALAWLESLAAKQGADPNELVSGVKPKAEVSSTPEASDNLPNWMKTDSTPSAESQDTTPDWLKEPAPQAGDTIAEFLKDQPASASSTSSNDNLPDWMKEDSSPVAQSQDSMPDWMKTDSTPSAESQDTTPDWLKEPAPQAGDTIAEFLKDQPASASSTSNNDNLPDWMKEDSSPVAQSQDSMPDWMKEPETSSNDTIAAFLKDKPVTAALPTLPKEEEKPDWLKQMEAESDEYEATSQPKAKAPEPEVSAMPPSSEDDALAWLESLAAKQGADPNELVSGVKPKTTSQPTPQPPAQSELTKPEAAEEEIPEFMKAMGWTLRDPSKPLDEPNLFADEPEEEEQSDEAKPAQMPDWLKNLKPQEPQVTVQASKDAPDWLRAAMEGTAEPEAEAATPQEPVPDWLKESAPAAGDTIATFLKDKPATPEASAPSSEDDALAWLESLAAKQGADPNELVSTPKARKEMATDWLRQPEDEIAPSIESSSEDVTPDWLRTPQEETSLPMTPPTSAQATPNNTNNLTPEDDALAWLESLAAKQGADPNELVSGIKPNDQVSTPSWLSNATKELPPTEDAAEPSISNWLKQNQEEPEPQAESVPDWLKEPKPQASDTIATFLKDKSATPEEPLPAAATIAPSSDDDALAWLESLAAKHGADPNELVSGIKPNEEVATPDWLKQMEAESDKYEADLKIPSKDDAADIPDWVKSGTGELPPVATAVSDPALANWLQQEEQSSTTPDEDDVPSWLKESTAEVASDAAPNQLVADTPAPQEAPSATATTNAAAEDDALAWLESLAARQGADPNELVSSVSTRSTDTPEWVKKSAEDSPPQPQIESQPEEEKPTWLRQMEAESDYYENTLSAQPKPSEIPEWLQTKQIEDTIASIESPTDPQTNDLEWTKESAQEEKAAVPSSVTPSTPAAEDDALAWLESLAARQGANPDELVSGAADSENTDTPEWVKQSALDHKPPEPPVTPDKPEWLKQMEAKPDEPNTSQIGVTLDDEVPAWLKTPEPDPNQNVIAFLKDKPKTSRLVAPVTPPTAPEPEHQTDSAPVESEVQPVVPAPKAAEPTPAKPTPRAEKPKRSHKAKTKPAQQPDEAPVLLSEARAHLNATNIGVAIANYSAMIKTGEMIEEIIADLETANQKYPNTTDLMRTLGDAYMKKGQLQDSLNIYRRALQNL